MTERLALVVASECAAFPRLGFTGELAAARATQFYAVHGSYAAASELGSHLPEIWRRLSGSP
jgi:hypothetical protein